MVVGTRTIVCVRVALAALASSACGVTLPPPEDDTSGAGSTSDAREPSTTKQTTLPTPAAPGKPGDSSIGVSEPTPPTAPPSTPPSTPPLTPTPTAPRTFTVFVSAGGYPANALGSGAADSECAKRAAANGSAIVDGRNKKWKAWLSNANVDARDRLGTTPGPWQRVDGKIVIDREALRRGDDLREPIAQNEYGGFVGDTVWTGTADNGVRTASHCLGWTSFSGNAVIGRANDVSSSWTSSTVVSCASKDGDGDPWQQSPVLRRIYCFEVE